MHGMKKQVTITVDAEVLSIAKRHAHSRNLSLSSLIEGRLREIAGEETGSFAARWRGHLRAARRANPRYDTLAHKYL